MSQSSFNWLGEAWKAVDGNSSPDYDTHLSCVHTDAAPSWWQIDLGAEVAVSRVQLQNRRDPNADRLSGARVYVGGDRCEGYLSAGDDRSCPMSGRHACGHDQVRLNSIIDFIPI